MIEMIDQPQLETRWNGTLRQLGPLEIIQDGDWFDTFARWIEPARLHDIGNVAGEYSLRAFRQEPKS